MPVLNLVQDDGSAILKLSVLLDSGVRRNDDSANSEQLTADG